MLGGFTLDLFTIVFAATFVNSQAVGLKTYLAFAGTLLAFSQAWCFLDNSILSVQDTRAERSLRMSGDYKGLPWMRPTIAAIIVIGVYTMNGLIWSSKYPLT